MGVLARDERDQCVRQNRVVLASRRWGQARARRTRGRWRLSSPALQGEHEISRQTVAQGMPDVSAYLWWLPPAFFVAGGPWVRRAPGIPCALWLKGTTKMQNSGVKCAAGMRCHIRSVIASAAKQSIVPQVEEWIASLRSQW